MSWDFNMYSVVSRDYVGIPFYSHLNLLVLVSHEASMVGAKGPKILGFYMSTLLESALPGGIH